MKMIRNPSIKVLLIITLCLGICGGASGGSTDTIELRKYPSADSKVVETLSRKHPYRIIESFSSWRYIVVDASKYGGGWVQVRDLQKESTEIPVSQTGTSNAEQNVQKAPPTIKTIKKEKAVEVSPLKKTGAPGNKNGKRHSRSDLRSREPTSNVTIKAVSLVRRTKKIQSEKAFNKTAKIPSVEKPEPAVSNSVAPSKPTLPSEETVHLPQDTGITARKANGADSGKNPEMLVRSPEPRLRIPNNIFPGEAEASVNPAGHARRPDAGQRHLPGDMPQGTYQSAFNILNLALKLFSVVLSCFAIIFAYKAKRMADLSYRLTLQLQQTIKTDRVREFDERY